MLLGVTAGCGGGADADSERGDRSARGGDQAGRAGGGERGGGRPGGGRPGGPPAPPAEGGVPVEVATVERGDIAAFFTTQATLEAENEVDVVARVSGPIVELLVEEGDRVRRGQRIARLDDRELR
ncbi:MAG: biotin/lipoyl-binding protein, partial [Acidobacteriota bacterium]